MEREFLNVPEDEIDDFTNENCTWKIQGKKYKYIDKIRVNGDGEWYGVIVQRQSDKKYFQFDWGIGYSQRYHYESKWREVKPKVVTEITYDWDEK